MSYGGEEEGEKEEERTGGQKPHKLLPSCAQAAWHGQKEKGSNWRLGRDGVTPQNRVPRASQGTQCTPQQGKGISCPANTVHSRSLWELFLLLHKFKTKKKRYLDISPKTRGKKHTQKRSFLHIKIPSPLQRHSCSYCFRANIIGYVFSKGAVFQTRWFLSSRRETETTQSQQCSAPRQRHPHFGGRQKDDS